MITIARTTDIDSLMRWREEVIRNVFDKEPDAALLVANRSYYERNIPTGRHIALTASYDECECGCGGMCLEEELPSPDNPTGLCAYLMNIYVREPYRHHGIAHHIVKHLLEVAKEKGCGKIYLETTDDGRPVYASLGFKELPDMMKYYGKNN